MRFAVTRDCGNGAVPFPTAFLLSEDRYTDMAEKIRKSIIAVALSAAVLLTLFSCALPNNTADTSGSDNVERIETLESVRERIRYIIHGAGKLEGHNLYGEVKFFTCSNSLEGFRQCLEQDCEFVETDFSFTSDGELVCIHDWYPSYSDDIHFEGDALSLEAFMNTKIFRQYTPVSLDMLADMLKSNKRLFIITDIKDDNIGGLRYIAEKYPDLTGRFIAQIYSESEYAHARELGYDYIIYTLYRLDWNSKTDTERHRSFAETNPLVGIAFSYELCEVPGFLDGMKKAGVPLFVHTVNDREEQDMYFSMGIQGVYTDEVIGKQEK